MKLLNLPHITYTLGLTTFFQIWQNPPEENGKIREIAESAITLCNLTSFFQMNKKILTYNRGNHAGREPLRGQR